MVLASKLYIESVRYSHVQEEFIYWLEYLKSRRKFIEVNNTKEDVHIAQVYVTIFTKVITAVVNIN